jgi:hypothetical protein
MPLPRSYASSSPTPKSTLQTLVVKLDKFALIDYTTLSTSHRAARVRLKIRWGSTGHEQGWAMEDIGCHTVAEAENYVATLAVHQLNAVEGKGEKGLWRVLPPVFRDLWDELDEVRKENVDRARREKWGMLRAILDTRIAGEDAESKVRLLLLRIFGIFRIWLTLDLFCLAFSRLPSPTASSSPASTASRLRLRCTLPSCPKMLRPASKPSSLVVSRPRLTRRCSYV